MSWYDDLTDSEADRVDQLRTDLEASMIDLGSEVSDEQAFDLAVSLASFETTTVRAAFLGSL